MPIPPRTPRRASRYGQATLDPSRPLYVCRRISMGAAGALVVGQLLDASTVAPWRLRNWYAQGYIAHEQPKTVAMAVSAALARAQSAPDAPPPPEVVAPVELVAAAPAKPPKRARAGA